MKAIVYTKYGSPDVLTVRDVGSPSPRAGEVLVRTRACAANFSDWAFLHGKPLLVRVMGSGLIKPRHRILGADIAGDVVEVGQDVTDLSIGDPVFGDISPSGWGGFAEYVCAREEHLARKPDGVSYTEAAASGQAAVTALQAVRDIGRLARGEEILVIGASGGIGSFVVQIAKEMGARVTAASRSKSFEFLRSIGADTTIDSSCQDPVELANQYDVIVTTAGYIPISRFSRALKDGGRYVMVGGDGKQLLDVMLRGRRLSKKGSKVLTNLAARPDKDDLETIGRFLESRSIRAAIDRSFPFEETPEALRYYGRRQNRGRVVIDFAK